MCFSALVVTGGDNGVAFNGSAVTLICTEVNAVSPDGPYKWYQDGGEIPGETGETIQINPDNQSKAGTYKCEATFSTIVVQSADLTFRIYGRERSFQI